MTGLTLAPIGMLLLVACLIAMLSRRLGLPYIVGLVVAGFLIALLPNSPDFPLSRELIFNVLLPPLVFEAALQLALEIKQSLEIEQCLEGSTVEKQGSE